MNSIIISAMPSLADLTALREAATRSGLTIVVVVRPDPPSAALAFDALADSMCQAKKSSEVFRKKSAWERRNPNAPFYRHLKKSRR